MRVGEERMGREGVLNADSKKKKKRNGMMARGKVDAFKKNKCVT